MAGLCALADLKTWLGITDTTQDAKLQLMIDMTSEQMIAYLGYNARRATYTSEVHTINNSQLMYLNAAPIQSVATVLVDGVAILPGTASNQYQFDAIDAKAGRIYLGNGFCGNSYTRNMTYDIVAGFRSVYVTYTAGWYMPEDANYSLGADTSLPLAISSACIQEVSGMYRRNMAQGEGLSSYREGGISWGWDLAKNAGGAGLSDSTVAVLNVYRRWGSA